MPKIGVLTFSFTIDNYGQVLQYLATQEFLQSKGFESVLVEPSGWRISKAQSCKRRIRGLIDRIKGKWHTFRYDLAGIPQAEVPDERRELSIEEKKMLIFNQWKEVTERKEKEHSRHFEDFKKRYFHRQNGTYNDILENGYSAFCIGSDQTWSCAGWHMMLGWVPDGIKRFSIAPSVGHSIYTDHQVDGFKRELKKFDFVTVREDNGLELCQRCGYSSAIKVLDPVFLLSANDYEPYMEEVDEGQAPYILVYLLGADISLSMKEIVDFCESSGYKIKYVESQGRDESFESIPATIGQWLGLIKNASYILTNSFHGTAFSIIFHKPFLVFPIVGLLDGMNGRIIDICAQLELSERIYREELNELFSPIEWKNIDDKIEKNKQTLDSLIDALALT